MLTYARPVAQILLLSYYVYIVVFTQKTEPPDLDLYELSAQNICQFLITSDKQLVKFYSEKPKGKGEEIMNLFREYNDNLAILVKRLVREHVNNDTLTTLAEVQPLVEHGGPEFINFYVERSILENEFKLNNLSSRIIVAQRQNTIDLWQDFFKMTSKIPDGDDDDVV